MRGDRERLDPPPVEAYLVLRGHGRQEVAGAVPAVIQHRAMTSFSAATTREVLNW